MSVQQTRTKEAFILVFLPTQCESATRKSFQTQAFSDSYQNCTTFHSQPQANFGKCCMINPTFIKFGQFFTLSFPLATIWVVHLPEPTETGLITELGQTVWAVYSCNSWFVNLICSSCEVMSMKNLNARHVKINRDIKKTSVINRPI